MKLQKRIIAPVMLLSGITVGAVPLVSLSSCANQSHITSWDFAKQGYYIPNGLPETRIYEKSENELCKEYFQKIKDGHKDLYITDMLFAHNVIAYSYSQYESDKNNSFLVTPDIANIEINNDEVRVDGSLKINVKSTLGDINIEWIWKKMKANLSSNDDSRLWELFYGYKSAEGFALDDQWQLDAHIAISDGKFDFVGINKDSVNLDWFNTIIGHFSNFTTVNVGSLCYTYIAKNSKKPIMWDFSNGTAYTPQYTPLEAQIDPGKSASTEHYAGIIRESKYIFADDALADISVEDINTYKFKGKILVSTIDVYQDENGNWRICYDLVLDGTADGQRVLSCIEMLDLKFCVKKASEENTNWYSCLDYDFDLDTRESSIWSDDGGWQIGIYSVGGQEKFIETYDVNAKETPIDKFTIEFITSLEFTDNLHSMSKVTIKG